MAAPGRDRRAAGEPEREATHQGGDHGDEERDRERVDAGHVVEVAGDSETRREQVRDPYDERAQKQDEHAARRPCGRERHDDDRHERDTDVARVDEYGKRRGEQLPVESQEGGGETAITHERWQQRGRREECGHERERRRASYP